MAMVEFRRMQEQDLPLVARWLAADHVQEWWRDPTAPEKVREKYLPRIRGVEPTDMFVVAYDGHDVGFIQSYRLADHPSWHTTITGSGLTFSSGAGIDCCIGDPDFTGRGIGSAMIEAFASRVFAAYPEVDCIVVTPQEDNSASCRVLEKAGYGLAWRGMLESDDPSDVGPAALYVRDRQT